MIERRGQGRITNTVAVLTTDTVISINVVASVVELIAVLVLAPASAPDHIMISSNTSTRPRLAPAPPPDHTMISSNTTTP